MRACCQAFGAFLPAWEAAVADALPPGRRAWLAGRSRARFLSRDLEALGLAPPAPVRLPGFRNAAAAWGSLYVLEGSALGGQVITRSLAARGLLPNSGGAYFHGWGEATAAMWREFRDLLEAELRDPDALAPACEAACRTFESLSSLLEDHLHERPALA
ncbi:MAG: biliverdin-producing heme oxygenase [Ramlibacter sp.]